MWCAFVPQTSGKIMGINAGIESKSQRNSNKVSMYGFLGAIQSGVFIAARIEPSQVRVLRPILLRGV
jgi:hypothetical protein